MQWEGEKQHNCHILQTGAPTWAQDYLNLATSLWQHQPSLGSDPARGQSQAEWESIAPYVGYKLAWAQMHFLSVVVLTAVMRLA